MTWVVAGAGIVHPFMAGDVRVTFGAQRGMTVERDCLVKIYPVARNIIAGFAGSVRIGMTTLGTIAAQLSPDHRHSLPGIVARWLPRLLRRRFGEAPERERSLGSQFLFMSAHPLLRRGDAPWPQADVYRFVAPAFEPIRASGLECLGIGSGQEVELFRSRVNEIASKFSFHQSVMGGLAFPAQTMADHLHRLLLAAPIPGVSPYFVYASLSLEEMVIEPFTYKVYEEDGPRQVAPPPLARGYEAFLEFCRNSGALAEAAGAV